jgi:hypothetical protein
VFAAGGKNMYGSAFVIMLSIFRSAAKLQQPLGDAGNDHTPFDSSFDGLVEKTLRQWHVPGLSIAVVDNGKIASKVACLILCSLFYLNMPSLGHLAEWRRDMGTLFYPSNSQLQTQCT